MWNKGQSWRVVNSLNKLNEQVRAYAPRAVPPATDVNAWGSIADGVHSTSSDHYPHFYSALGGTAVVCARDFPNAPTLGLNAWTFCEHLRQVRDPRVQYIICNGKITGVSYGWTWHTYTGDDPHDTHFHVSSVHSAIADSTATWSLPGAAVAPQPIGRTHMILLAVDGIGAVQLVGPGGMWHVPSQAALAEITAATGLKPLSVSQADFNAIAAAAMTPAVPVQVDAAAVAAAVVADPSLAILIKEQSFEAAQQAEDS
jgi:hypothetical protein